jgi:hypothetical protein
MFVVLSTFLCSSAWGQIIGLAPEEIDAIYGQPVKRVNESHGWADVYRTNGWEITVRYQSFKSAEVIFRDAEGKAIDTDDREYLINYLADGEEVTPLSATARWCGEKKILRFKDDEVSIESVYAFSRDKPGDVREVRSPSSKPEKPANVSYELEAEVKSGSDRMKVKNVSGWRWTSVRVCLNSGIFNDGYYYDLPALNNGVAREIPLTNFATKKGERFLPIRHVVKKIYIKAKDPSGMIQSATYQ